jgi:hypothetical protein
MKILKKLRIFLSKLNDFEVKLRRFSLKSKLEVCRKIAHSIDINVPPLKLLKIFANPQQKSILDDLPKTSFLFEMEYMALASTINEEWNGPITMLSDYEDFRKIINSYKSYGTAPKKKSIESFEWNMYFLRLGLQQHKLSSLLFENLLIYDYFYTFEDNNFNLKSLFEAEFKYDYESYVLFVICLFTLSSAVNRPLDLETILNSFSKLKQLNANMIIDMINILSATKDDIIDLHDQYKIPTRKYRNFDYNPYSKYPILDHHNLLYIPVPQYLFGAITEGFYHRLCEKGGLQFREKFGKIIFEKYVGKILERYCKDLTIISEFEYGKEKKRSPDYILVKKKDIIFIEIKATTPAVSLRGNDFEVFKKQLIKGFGNGVLQCIKKEKDLNNRIMKHAKFPKNWDNIYYMIIDLEDFHIPPSELVTSIIKELCEEKKVKYIEQRKPLMLSVQFLISIFEEFDGDVFDFMKIWSNDKQIRFPDTYIDQSKFDVKELSSYKYFWDIIESVRR